MIDSYSSYALSVLGRSQRTVTEYCKEIRAFARWLAPDLDPFTPRSIRKLRAATHCCQRWIPNACRRRKPCPP